MTYLAFIAGVLALPALLYFVFDAFVWMLQQFYQMIREMIG